MVRFDGAKLRERLLVKRVERTLFERLGQENFFITDISVVSEQDIREYNLKERGKDSVTDVLSFPCFEGLRLPVSKEDFSAADTDCKRVILGSIMICRKRAEEQAEAYGHSYAREIGFLACHGLLHLLGYDHIEPEDEREMISIQNSVLEAAGLSRRESKDH